MPGHVVWPGTVENSVHYTKLYKTFHKGLRISLLVPPTHGPTPRLPIFPRRPRNVELSDIGFCGLSIRGPNLMQDARRRNHEHRVPNEDRATLIPPTIQEANLEVPFAERLVPPELAYQPLRVRLLAPLVMMMLFFTFSMVESVAAPTFSTLPPPRFSMMKATVPFRALIASFLAASTTVVTTTDGATKGRGDMKNFRKSDDTPDADHGHRLGEGQRPSPERIPRNADDVNVLSC